ncbi:MBL fold metallo-hydrolase [Microbacterium sp. zg-Y818]|uniref:MBL fold metallo-hydrolase n=1 Tax=unclassified Microbacterium TaxID=2609290 RepID=UPI00214AD4A9|nr:MULTISPECIES: MBL fold metallo-hydrolase [unclassified Microbacterium]MCR2800472.1 MBL fold metallo-hydrolase [Microbacterium sp. zg.Y818]WIM22428.1 MBL fold metallo-hydrolase [Microbacterium sp. zg-Y818]
MLTPIADGVFVHQSDLLRNNTVVVSGDAGALLVDPGITDAEMSCLADDLRALGMPVVAGFATHPDWDHALWHPALGDAPRYGTAEATAFLRDLRTQPDWQQRFADALPPEIVTDVPIDLFGLIEALPDGASHLPWKGPAIRVLAHPAHATGHAALVVEGCRVLIAGDMLSDVFVPMPDLEGVDDPLGDYLAGLDALAAVADRVDAFVPGHGSVGDAAQLRRLLELDRRYIHTLRDGGPFDDPRIDAPEPGWEWVGDLHAGQVESAARRGGDSAR